MPDSRPEPAELQKLLAGNRAAIVGAGRSAQEVPPGRTCANCYFNPTGQICQRWPMDMQINIFTVDTPDPQLVGKKVQQVQKSVEAAPRHTPPGYSCGEHRYPHEMAGKWGWDDREPQKEPANVASRPGA